MDKGASIKYIRAEGEGGVGPNADVVLRLSKRGCVILRTRGRRGSNKPKNLRTYLMEAPLGKSPLPLALATIEGEEERRLRLFVQAVEWKGNRKIIAR